MAELADALALGASARKGVQVQVLFPAPSAKRLGKPVKKSAHSLMKLYFEAEIMSAGRLLTRTKRLRLGNHRRPAKCC
jgi:hypothetical protein